MKIEMMTMMITTPVLSLPFIIIIVSKSLKVTPLELLLLLLLLILIRESNFEQLFLIYKPITTIAFQGNLLINFNSSQATPMETSI